MPRIDSNHYGFTSNQLVLRKNHNLLNVNIGKNPPVLQNITTSKLVANNWNAIHVSRNAFIETETSEKSKRAVMRKVRLPTSSNFQLRDKVYSKRQDSNRWRGPGKILGIEKYHIFVYIMS